MDVAKNVVKNALKMALICLVLIMIPTYINAEEVKTKKELEVKVEWYKKFEYKNLVEINDVIKTDDGYILVGYKQSDNKAQCYIIKTDINGKMIWEKSFGQGIYNSVSTVLQTKDGGYIIGGTHLDVYNAETAESDITSTIIRLDKNGDVLWSNTLTNYHGSIYKIIENNNSNFIFMGQCIDKTKKNSTSQNEEPEYIQYISAVDKGGNIIYENMFSSDEYSIGINDMVSTKDGGYAVTGYIFEGDDIQPNCIVIKYDKNGNFQWKKTMGADSSDFGSSILQTNAGDILVSGYTNTEYSFNTQKPSKAKCLVTLLDEEGNMKWHKKLGDNMYGKAITLIEKDNNIFQMLCDDPLNKSNRTLISFDINGNVLDTRSINILKTNKEMFIHNDNTVIALNYIDNNNSEILKLKDVLLTKYSFKTDKYKKTNLINNDSLFKDIYNKNDDVNYDMGLGPKLLETMDLGSYSLTRFSNSCTTKDGSIILVVPSDFNDDQDKTTFIKKIDGNNNLVYDLKLEEIERALFVKTVIELNDGNILLAGNVRGYSYIYRIDTKGNILNKKTFEGSINLGNLLEYDKGYTYSCTIDSICIMTRMDLDFNIQWSIPIGEDEHDNCDKIKILDNGDYIILGNRYVNKVSYPWLKRINSEGKIVWNNQYNSKINSLNRFDDFIITDKEIVTCGQTKDDSTVVSKLNHNGEVIWSKVFNGGRWLSDSTIIKTSDSCYLIGHNISIQSDNGESGFKLYKIDNDGKLIWTKIINSNYGSDIICIAETNDNKFSVLYKKMFDNKQDLYKSNYNYVINKIDNNISEDTKAPKVNWMRSLGGSDNEFPISLKITDNGYLVNGYTNSKDVNPYVDSDWIVNLNKDGAIEWFITNKPNMVIRDTMQISDGYLIVGDTYDINTGLNNINLIKIDKKGKVIWEKTYNRETNDMGLSIDNFDKNKFIIKGLAYSSKNKKLDTGCFFIQIDAKGNKSKEYIYKIDNNNDLSSLNSTNDGGNILILNKAKDEQYYESEMIKLNKSGKKQWSKIFKGEEFLIIRSMYETNDGYRLLAYDKEITKTVLIDINEKGAITAQKDYMFKGMKLIPRDISNTKDGGFILIGNSKYTDSRATLLDECMLIKYDAKGNKQWEKRIGGSGYDVPLSIHQTEDNGYILLGHTNSDDGDITDNHGGYDYWIVKLSPEGNIQK